MLTNDNPPHPAATDWSRVYPTGRMRWNHSPSLDETVLEVEMAQDWTNELGQDTVTEWQVVPTVIDGR